MTVVVVTRPDDDGELTRLLSDRGAVVAVHPLLRIAAPRDPARLDAAARTFASFDLVAFTSRHAVESLLAAAGRMSPAPSLAGPALAAVGARTAERLRDVGLTVAIVPKRADAHGLVGALERSGPLRGRRVLLPLGDQARRVLPDALERRGALVTEVIAYRTVFAGVAAAEAMERQLLNETIDVVTWASGSAVSALVAAIGPARARACLSGSRQVVLGRTASAALARLGVRVAAASSSAALSALADAALRAGRVER